MPVLSYTGNTFQTTAFNLDLSELIEEAFERCGAELRTGYDLHIIKDVVRYISNFTPPTAPFPNS